MRGDGDVDLLVAREDGGRLQVLLAELGFKQSVAAAEAQTPGVVSYFGFDPTLPRLLHVHVHFQVRIGDAWALNYHLPLERAMLASARPGALFRVPTPELEFIVFVLRMTLAQSVRNKLMGTGETRRAREWEYLAGRVRQEQVRLLLREHLPAVPTSLFERCVRALSPRSALSTRIYVGWRLSRALAAEAQRTVAADALRRTIRRAVYVMRLAARRPRRRQRLLCGGLVVAILGGDGAGKTTVVRDLTSWLGSTFETRCLHLGKPPRSLATLMVAVMNRIARRFSSRPWTTLLHIRALCIARDRYRLYRRSRREASRGRIVVCDRYPTRFISCMDGPSAATAHSRNHPRWWLRAPADAEARCYDRILPPELLIVLRVDPEVAVARKTDEDAAYVRTRSGEVWRLDLHDAPLRVVDANRSSPEVVDDVRQLVWSVL